VTGRGEAHRPRADEQDQQEAEHLRALAEEDTDGREGDHEDRRGYLGPGARYHLAIEHHQGAG
jgi:hypothetical protein